MSSDPKRVSELVGPGGLPPHLVQKISRIAKTDEPEPEPPTEEELALAHLRRCGLPEKSCWWIERNGGVAALRARSTARAIERWYESEKLVLVLKGVTGTLKTTLLAVAMLRCKKKRQLWDAAKSESYVVEDYDDSQVQFVSIDELTEMRLRWADEAWFWQRLKHAPLLFLDDIGAERLPKGEEVDEAMLEKVQTVMNFRDGARLKTVWTTNSTIPELAKRYGDRVGSRLAQEATVVSCGDVDRRRTPDGT